MTKPQAFVPPASTAVELRSRLEALAAPPGKKLPPTKVLAALRGDEDLTLSSSDADAITARVTVLDPSWSVHLEVVRRQLPRRRSQAAGVLSSCVVSSARAAGEYPEVGSREPTDILAWTHAKAGMATDLPPALIATALWPHRQDPFYVDALFTLLEGWTRASLQLFDSDRTEKAAHTYLASGPAGKAKATNALALVQYYARGQSLALADLEKERDARVRVAARVATADEAKDEAARRAALQGQRAAALEHELTEARELAANELREARTEAQNTVGRLRSRVLSALELELPQIRGYLDRPTPNTVEALTRLEHLEELVKQMQNER